MARNDTREQTLLDQYWDADIEHRQYIPAELDASLLETVDRLNESDDAPAPDPAFVDQLWTDIAGESSTATPTSTSPVWTIDPDDEPTEPQFIPGREENDMQTRQQSIWRRRSRQIGELVAGVLVMALVTGGLILAYQNLIGEGEGDIPGTGDDLDGFVPNLSSAGAIPWDGDILQRNGVGSVEIGQFNGQDYAFVFTVPGTQAGADAGPELRTVRLDRTGQHEQAGSLELDIPWTSSIGVAMGKMALVDDVLYLPIAAEQQPGIWAVDVSDPANPEEVAFVDIDAGYPTTIAGSENGVLVTATFDGPMYFINISNLEQPEIATQVESSEFGFHSTVEAPRMTFDDDRLFIAHYEGLSVVDLSDVSSPEQIAYLENPEFDPETWSPQDGDLLGPFPDTAWHDVVVVGDIVHIAAGDGGVLLFDISDTSSPVEAGQIALSDRTVRLGFAGDYLLALGVSSPEEEIQPGEAIEWIWSIETIDTTSPDDPQSLSRLDDLSDGLDYGDFLSLNTREFTAGQNFVLTFGQSGSLVAHIDWIEPQDDQSDDIAEELPTPEPDTSVDDIEGLVPAFTPAGIFAQGGEVLQNAELGSIQVARHDGQDYAYMLTFPMSEDGEEVYPTIQVLRMARDGQPETVGSIELASPWSGPMQFNIGQMALVDGVLYVPMPLEARSGVWAVDISNPESPTEVGFLDIEDDWPMTLVAEGDVAVATGMFGNVYFFLDISDSAEPVVASQLESSEIELHASVEVPALTMHGENLYIAHPRGLTILDVSDPSNPEGLAAIENPAWEGLEGIEGAGNDTQVAISDEDSMLDRLVDPDAYHDVAVVGDHAYVAAGDAGVLVFDVSDPSDPQAAEPVQLDSRTFRLTESVGFVYALGVASEEEDDERQQPVWAWSFDVLEHDDPDEPQIVSQLENLIPSDAGDDAAGFFLMSAVRQASVGQDFSFAWGRAGAYVAAIDWVEPGDDGFGAPDEDEYLLHTGTDSYEEAIEQAPFQVFVPANLPLGVDQRFAGFREVEPGGESDTLTLVYFLNGQGIFIDLWQREGESFVGESSDASTIELEDGLVAEFGHTDQASWLIWRDDERNRSYRLTSGVTESNSDPLPLEELIEIAESLQPYDSESEAVSLSAQPSIETDELIVYFPRQAEQPGIDYDDVPAPGELVLDGAGCLRLDEDGPVIVWPHSGFSVQLIDDQVTVINDQSEAIASVGEEISLHGSPIPGRALQPGMLQEPLPDACADAESYRITGPGIRRP